MTYEELRGYLVSDDPPPAPLTRKAIFDVCRERLEQAAGLEVGLATLRAIEGASEILRDSQEHAESRECRARAGLVLEIFASIVDDVRRDLQSQNPLDANMLPPLNIRRPYPKVEAQIDLLLWRGLDVKKKLFLMDRYLLVSRC
jgi:hypothetical protein